MLNLANKNLTNDIQDLAAHQVAQADAQAAQAAENLRQLIARKFDSEQAEIVKAEINARLNSADIPDADENSSAAEAIAAYEAIATFYAGIADQIKAGTFPAPTADFTHSVPMTAEAFWSRVKHSDATVIQSTGYTDVYNTAGELVARWLGAGINRLWYTPQEEAQEWPPRCPDCDGQMSVKHQGGTGLPFFSCSNFPFCRGRREFSAHPDDIAEAGDAYRARFASLERAKGLGLVEVSARGQRQVRARRLERARLDARDTALPVATLYDLARRAVEQHAAAFPVDSIGIWKNAHLTIFIRQGEGELTMHAINDDPRKAQRVRCGYVDQDRWHFELSRADYDRWATKARRLA